jgi:glucose/arabinose dehydrogenase
MKKGILLLCMAALCNFLNAQTLPTGFAMADIITGVTWNEPVGLVFSPDGNRLFVWEKGGKVFVCNRQANGSYTRQTTPVLDISGEVGNWRDFGLTGFALDPEFAVNGYIYLLYVVDRHHLMTDGLASRGYNAATNQYYAATIGRVTKYKTQTNGGNLVANTSTRKILIGETPSTGMPILHQSHGVGSLAFAADGTLLVTNGDAASYNGNDGGNDPNTYYQQALTDGIIRPEENVGAFRSQMLNSHNGKLLRIDKETGDGISSNPYYDAQAPRSAKSRVWALGLRNPFRMSVKPGSGSTLAQTGDIGEVFIGDVGMNTWEELNIAKSPGMNFGWPVYEGHTLHTGYSAMNVENKDEPNNFGACQGRQYYRFIDLIKQDNAAKNKKIYNPCDAAQLIGDNIRFLHARPALDWRHGSDNARVGKFNAAGQATQPSIGSTESGVTGSVFRGNSSSGGIWYTGAGSNPFPAEYKNNFILLDYGGRWVRRLKIDFTDVVTKVDPFITNMGAVVAVAENPKDGSIVCINYGSPGGTVKKITLGNAPPVAIIRADKNFGGNNLTVNFDGSESYDPNGTINRHRWDFGDPGKPGNTVDAVKPSYTFSSTGTGPKKYTVTLTVRDNNNVSTSTQYIVSIRNTPPVVAITSPVDESLYKVGSDSLFALKANVTDLEHSAAQLSYEWQSTLKHNNHEHPEAIDPAVETSSLLSRIGCNGDDYHWMITLKVTDNEGLSSTDTARVRPNCAGTLPIFLHKFSVTKNGAANMIKWTTELESNMEYFELERSTDGVHFSAINKQAARNTPGSNIYEYTDHSASSGVTYYRLKIAEHGEIMRYSVIIKAVGETEKTGLKVVPNPVVGNFSLAYQSVQDDLVTIEIRDVAGKLVHSVRETVTRGHNVIYLQSSPAWNAGVYFISVKDKNETKQVKFIKVK